MIIDPKKIILDANERRILQLALDDYIKDMRKRADRVKRDGLAAAYRDDAARAYDLKKEIENL